MSKNNDLVRWLRGRATTLDNLYNHIDAKHLRDAAAAIERGAAQGLRVKPLEWRTHPSYFGWRAESIIGAYRVDAETRCWRLIGVSKSASFTSSDEAKAAAQADYERRILSALVTPPAPAPDAGEDERLFCSHCSSRFHTDWERKEHEAERHPTPQPPAVEAEAVDDIPLLRDLERHIAEEGETTEIGQDLRAAVLVISDMQAQIKRLRRELFDTAELMNAARKDYLTTEASNKALREGLEWYGEQARLCRLIHREGDAGREALSDDGGRRARALLSDGGQ